MENMYGTIGQSSVDNLLAGTGIPLVSKGITLAKGQGVLKRGTVAGLVTTTSLGFPVDSAKTDGTEVPYGVLTDDVDTGDGTATDDVKTTVYVSGLFNSAALTFGGTDDAKKHETKLRELGIFLKDNIKY